MKKKKNNFLEDFRNLENEYFLLHQKSYKKLKELFDYAGINELEIPIDPEDDDIPVLWSDNDNVVKRICMLTDSCGVTFSYVSEDGVVMGDSMVSPVDAGIVALQILGV